jgi:2-dehydro-3-deoxyphosphogalactonate aldolase
MILADALAELPVVAILRGVTPDEVEAHAEVLHAAGVRAVEVPLNSPDPLISIRRLAKAWGERMAVGAGTVLTRDQVDAVRDAGGTLVVAPNTDAAVIARAVELGLEAAPGVATATEAFAAIAAGARHLKLFPAATYGPGHLKQLGAVLPAGVNVWAVGGVGPDGMAAWWAAGARAFGVGSELYRPGQSPAETGVRAQRIALAARAAREAG